MTDLDDDSIDIKELAEELGRAPHTVRQWVREKALPRDLRPKKVGGRRQLVWRRDQLSALRQFADERAAKKGWQGA